LRSEGKNDILAGCGKFSECGCDELDELLESKKVISVTRRLRGTSYRAEHVERMREER